MTIQDEPALLLVDIQKGLEDIDYYGGHRNNLDAEEKALDILTFWRENHLPIFHIKHNSTHPNSRLGKGKPGNNFKEITQPLGSEPVIEKEVNSAFIGTNLQAQLDEKGIRKLVIVGLTTDHCVSSTVRMAGNLGYETFVVSDATATFDKISASGKKYTAEMIHEVELASLHGEFATVLETKELLEKLYTKSV